MFERPVPGEKSRATWFLGFGYRLSWILLMVAVVLGAEAIVEGQDGNWITAAVLAVAALGMGAGWQALR